MQSMNGVRVIEPDFGTAWIVSGWLKLTGQGFSPGDRLFVSWQMRGDDRCLSRLHQVGNHLLTNKYLYRDREISHILRDAEPRAVVADEPISASVPVWTRTVLRAAMQNSPAVRPTRRLDGDSPAGIIYTSGTTGTSKGAVLSHNNFAVNALNVLTCWQITSSDRFLLALPLFHVHGLGNGLHCWLMSGCRTKLLERFSHQSVCETFLQFRPTLFFGVPTMYVRMLEWEPAHAP
jgi:malonyl-CoA/methylmalonyl-CoA synthetase